MMIPYMLRPCSFPLKSSIQDYRTLLSQLEHAFNSSSQFSLQKLWFYVHPTVHTLFLIYQLILELATADQDDTHSESESDIDPEEEARNEALGLGGAKLRAVLSEITKNSVSGSSGILVKGGEVLTIIYDRMQNMNGDPTASVIYGTLLRAAGKPYVDMIRDWVSTGKLIDPYEELLVKESKFINREILEMDYTDEYWERRYTVGTVDDYGEMELIQSGIHQLRDGSTSASSKRSQAGVPPLRPNGRLPGGACIPPLLEGWKHKILLAGKYLNVIRECGIELRPGDLPPDTEEFSMDNEKCVETMALY